MNIKITTPKPDIAESLAEQIFSNQISVGTLLPREIDLCEQFSVSRSTVRSALQTLVNKGIVKRISGTGTEVREMSEWMLLDPKVMGWMTTYGREVKRFENEMFSFRAAVEPFVSSLAAQNATASDLQAIEKAFEGMIISSKQVDLTWQGRSHDDYDVAFHEAIYEATNNLIWTQLSHLLRPSITLIVEKSNFSADELQDSMERHRLVMEFIRLRKPEEAYSAAVAVLERTSMDLGINDPVLDLPHLLLGGRKKT